MRPAPIADRAELGLQISAKDNLSLRYRIMIWLGLLLAPLVPATGRAATLSCPPNPQVTEAIAGLRDTGEQGLDLLARQPDVAVCHLVRSLHVVRDTQVVGYKQAQHPKTMQVIWTLRALRYLAGCQDFRARTAENPAAWEWTRRGFLLPDDSSELSKKIRATRVVKFFQTWMSRDSVFIAPADAQQAIIVQWRHWYLETARHGYQYRACQSVDAWYF